MELLDSMKTTIQECYDFKQFQTESQPQSELGCKWMNWCKNKQQIKTNVRSANFGDLIWKKKTKTIDYLIWTKIMWKR